MDNISDSELNLFDLKNPDIGLFNLVDAEIIKLSGSKVLYYKYYPTNEYDEVYQEDRNKVIASQPLVVIAHYDPKVIEQEEGKWGLVETNEQIFTFNKDYITKQLGRAPIAGDIIKPLFQQYRFKVVQVQDDGFESYGIYHSVCTATILRDSEDVQDKFLPHQSDSIGNIEPE